MTPITDIRGHESEFSLPKNGFEYVQKKFADPPVGHIDSLDHPYVLDMERFLQQQYGASMVLVYDALVRKVGVDGYFQQADAAHIDHTPENCQWRLQVALDKRGLTGIKPRRIQLITAWKPLSNCVTQWPITVCDTSTVSREDCYPVDTVFPHYASELYHVGYNKAHKWFYLSNQTNEEVLIMQIYDSDAPDLAGCPHMAIDVGRDDIHKGRRDSTEVRAILVYM